MQVCRASHNPRTSENHSDHCRRGSPRSCGPNSPARSRRSGFRPPARTRSTRYCCEDRSITLRLLSDPALLDRRELTPIDKISTTRRERLIETPRIWIDTRGIAARTDELLDVHQQTVRYRMRNLETIFGEQLVDPESRFSTGAVLRAMQLCARSSAAPSDAARITTRARTSRGVNLLTGKGK